MDQAAEAVRRSTPSERQAQERRFYSRMALVIAAVIVLGFGPSFYLRPFDVIHFPRPNPPITPSLMVHSAIFSLWVVIFIAQTQLVAAGRRDVHKTLGAFGFMLGVVMVPVMYMAMMDAIARNSSLPFTDVLTFSVVPLGGIPFYIILLTLGWLSRKKDLQSHKRYMLALMIMLSQPAFARLPLAPPVLIGFTFLSALPLLLLISMAVWDRKTRGSVHAATKTSIALFALLLAIQTFFLATPGLWSAFVVHLPGIPA
ncbi:MAG: hypothetical protein U1E68_01230 [Sphingomonadaceae bacterium]|jgi:hypothetical protein